MKTEIIKYLKEDGSGKWLLIEPHLLYLQADSAKSYLRAMANSKYATGFHSETVKVIASRTNDIVGDERHLCLVDLGPGYPDKAVPIASYCKEKQIKFDYVPVDINEFFLDIAVKEIKKYADNVVPIHALIEKCADKIPDTFRNNALVMIGLTFMNFPPAQILPLLKQIGGEGARVLIASEIFSNEENIDEILRRYRTPEAQEVAFGSLRVLGLTASDVEYGVEFNSGRVEMSFRLKRQLKDPDLPLGATIITAVSYRYTENELRKSVQRYFERADFYWSEDKTLVVGILS